MNRPRFETAQVLGRNHHQFAQMGLNAWQQRTLHALRKCRTAALGGHIAPCDHPECGSIHLSDNSCRNRHCPKCQGHLGEAWIRKQEDNLLNVPYFHLVFTLPSELHPLCLQKPRLIYNLLFKTAWEVVHDFGQNPKWLGAKPAMIALLHTWGQNLTLHPHLHCIVPAGGITKKGRWKKAKKKGKFLFPVKALSKVFQARFVGQLRKQIQQAKDFFEALFQKSWVVYCKNTFCRASDRGRVPRAVLP